MYIGRKKNKPPGGVCQNVDANFFPRGRQWFQRSYLSDWHFAVFSMCYHVSV